MGNQQGAGSDLCGDTCDGVMKKVGPAACAMSWNDGCKNHPPPDGFNKTTTIGQLCPKQCNVGGSDPHGKALKVNVHGPHLMRDVNPLMASSKDAWESFCKLISSDLTETEVSGYSLKELHVVMSKYGVSNPIQCARIEIYWRVMRTRKMPAAENRTKPPTLPPTSTIDGVAIHNRAFSLEGITRPVGSLGSRGRARSRSQDSRATANPNCILIDKPLRSQSKRRSLTPQRSTSVSNMKVITSTCSYNNPLPSPRRGRSVTHRDCSVPATANPNQLQCYDYPVTQKAKVRSQSPSLQLPIRSPSPCKRILPEASRRVSDVDIFQRDVTPKLFGGPKGSFLFTLQAKAKSSPPTPPTTAPAKKKTTSYAMRSYKSPYGTEYTPPDIRVVPKNSTASVRRGMRFID